MDKMSDTVTIHVCGSCHREGHLAQVFPVETGGGCWEFVCSRCQDVVGFQLDGGVLDLGLVTSVRENKEEA